MLNSTLIHLLLNTVHSPELWWYCGDLSQVMACQNPFSNINSLPLISLPFLLLYWSVSTFNTTAGRWRSHFALWDARPAPPLLSNSTLPIICGYDRGKRPAALNHAVEFLPHISWFHALLPMSIAVRCQSNGNPKIDNDICKCKPDANIANRMTFPFSSCSDERACGSSSLRQRIRQHPVAASSVLLSLVGTQREFRVFLLEQLIRQINGTNIHRIGAKGTSHCFRYRVGVHLNPAEKAER